MRVQVNWSEMEHYSSAIEVDEQDMRSHGYDPSDDASIVRYLADDENSSWKEMTSSVDDFYGSDGAVILNARRA